MIATEEIGLTSPSSYKPTSHGILVYLIIRNRE
jgi:hypothetical protein